MRLPPRAKLDRILFFIFPVKFIVSFPIFFKTSKTFLPVLKVIFSRPLSGPFSAPLNYFGVVDNILPVIGQDSFFVFKIVFPIIHSFRLEFRHIPLGGRLLVRPIMVSTAPIQPFVQLGAALNDSRLCL